MQSTVANSEFTSGQPIDCKNYLSSANLNDPKLGTGETKDRNHRNK